MDKDNGWPGMAKLLPVVRVTAFAVFSALVVLFVADQYGAVRDMVRFVCINCLGLGD